MVDGKKMKQEESMVNGQCVVEEERKGDGKCCEKGERVVEKNVTVTVEK